MIFVNINWCTIKYHHRVISYNYRKFVIQIGIVHTFKSTVNKPGYLILLTSVHYLFSLKKYT